jgi:hypothetical protein
MNVPNRGLEAFLHLFIPVMLRERVKRGSAEYIRLRALAAMLVILTVASGVSNLVVGSYHVFFRPDLLGHDLVSISMFVLLLLQTLLFYKYQNAWMSCLAFTNFYFLSITVLLILSGGYESFGIYILLTCPMLAFLLGGTQEGIQNTLLCILFIIALVILDHIGFDLPNLFAGESPFLIFLVNWAFSLIVITATGVVYAIELQRGREASGERLTGRVSEWIEKIIPYRLKQKLTPDMADYAQAKILSVMLVVVTVLCFLSMMILVGFHLLVSPEQLKYDWIILLITFCFCFQLWGFHRFGSIRVSGRFLGYFYFLLVSGLVFVSGAYGTPLIVLFLLSPLVFFMVGRIQDGLITSVLIGLLGLGLVYLEQKGFYFENYFQAVSQPLIFLIIWIISLTGVGISMYVYDRELEKLT